MCFADVRFLTPRLVDGESDAAGAWAYGRLEVFDGAAFVPVADVGGIQELGCRGVQVACRTLGFETGAQALAGADSALPLLEGTGRDGRVGRILCTGDEDTLADCRTDSIGVQVAGFIPPGAFDSDESAAPAEPPPEYDGFVVTPIEYSPAAVNNDYDSYGRSVEDRAVALVCYNPSGT